MFLKQQIVKSNILKDYFLFQYIRVFWSSNKNGRMELYSFQTPRYSEIHQTCNLKESDRKFRLFGNQVHQGMWCTSYEDQILQLWLLFVSKGNKVILLLDQLS